MDALILYAIPVFLLLMGAEYLAGRTQGLQLYEQRDTLANLAMGSGNVLINLAWKSAGLAAAIAVYQYRLFDIPASAAWAWLLLLFAEDLCYYLFHRFHHESRIGWAAHVNHHSSRHFNLAVALRQSWTTPFTGMVFWLPLPLLGFHPLMVLTQQAISLLYQFWIHTQTIGRLGPLEWVLNTPSHHRVHHGTNPEYIDRNYGGILIIWDRLFGTFAAENAPVKYGIIHQLDTFNPLRIAFHEWRALFGDLRRATGIRQAAGFLLRHPGWQPAPRGQQSIRE
ncbi:MAG: sterol desaturase family protein [Gammaproteobacteria bacterium]|nr:sterol desaturase family protein [Gammaproteobacteria bacterium]NNF60532.1 sterol desaturase family protein [Gammaproteobacteria bacterium]NNM20286.1 sterol desaturase family protein [Gammaproteobacteria bacterium]